MEMQINRIVPRSWVDGPGQRVVIFVQGCTLACPGCQNRALWDAQGGIRWNVDALAQYVAKLGLQVTISGGEPFQQPRALSALVRALRQAGVQHIIVYSGYTWEQLTVGDMWDAGAYFAAQAALTYIDVLVDGPFVHSQAAERGSRNQRVIDVPATFEAQRIVQLDWETLVCPPKTVREWEEWLVGTPSR